MGTTLTLQSATVVGFANHPTLPRIIVFSTQGVDIYRTSDMQRVAWAAIPNVTCGAANNSGIYVGTSDAGIYRLPLTALDCANGDMVWMFGTADSITLSSFDIKSIATNGQAMLIATASECIYTPDGVTAYSCDGSGIVACAMSDNYIALATAQNVFIFSGHPTANWSLASVQTTTDDIANRLVFETGTDNLLICHTEGMLVVDCASPITNPVVPTSSGLIAHYTMANFSGTTLIDEVGTQNATINGATEAGSCLGGAAMSFDGSAFIEIPHKSTLKPTAGVTFSAKAFSPNWSSTGNVRIISCTESGGWSFEFDNPTAGYVDAVVNIGGTYYQASWNYTGLAAGCHTFTATCDGRYVKLYVDKTLVATADKGSTGSITYTNTNSIIIGGEAGASTGCTGNKWTGLIGIVRLYNRALTATEVYDVADEGTGDFGINYGSASIGSVTDCQDAWKEGDCIAYGTSNGSNGGRFGILQLDQDGAATSKTTVDGTDTAAVWLAAGVTDAIYDDTHERYRIVAEISPGANAREVRRDWALYAEITDALGGIQSGTVALKVNGQTVTPTTSAITNGYAVAYVPGANSGYAATNTIELSGTDSDGNTVSRTWSFVTATAPAATVTDTTPPNVVCTRNIGLEDSEADEIVGGTPVIWLDDITGPLIVTDAQAVAVGTIAIDGVTYHRHRRSVCVDPTDADGLQTRALQQGQIITLTCPAIGMTAKKCEVLACQRNLDDTDEITFDLQVAYYEAVS